MKAYIYNTKKYKIKKNMGKEKITIWEEYK
jgi:hypothetical protein